MADIAFLLLVFFMLTSISDMEMEIPINLPESRIHVSDTQKHFSVWINEKGEYIFDNKINSINELETFARYKMAANPDIRVLLNADRDIPFIYINNALEMLKEAGLYNIILISKKKNENKND